MNIQMNAVQSFKIESFSYYVGKYSTQLKQPQCVPPCLLELCLRCITLLSNGNHNNNKTLGHLQTFKSIMNKLSKNKSAPFPLYFWNIDSMESISTKKSVLKEVFTLFDTRNLTAIYLQLAKERIDATQIYCMILLLAKSDYDSALKCIVEVFGVQQPGYITRGQLFFVLDSMFRAFPKCFVVQNEAKPSKVNVRLDYQDINEWLNKMMPNKVLSKAQIVDAFASQKLLNNFLKYVHLRTTSSSEHAKDMSQKHALITKQVNELMRHMVEQVEKRLNPNKK